MNLLVAIDPQPLMKARRLVVPAGQLSLNWDEAAHPRAEAGTHEGRYRGGEFVPKDKAPEPTTESRHGDRKDVHRPAEMVPGDYEYLANSFPVETEQGTHTEWYGTDEWKALGSPKDGTAAFSEPGQCDHCGARHKYQVILRHKPTGELVSVGNQCYENRFSRPDWQNVVADQARRAELAAKRETNERQALAEMTTEEQAAYHWSLTDAAPPISQDIAGKVREWGPLSEKQRALLVRIHQETMERERLRAQAEAGPKIPVPEGKHKVTGVILGFKDVDSQFGIQHRMIVQDDRGFRVFGTVPRSLWHANKGDRVEFAATLERSVKEEAFGFFSRPTQAKLAEGSTAATATAA